MFERRSDEHVREAVGYALRGVKLAALKRRFTDDERRAISEAVVKHLNLCRWEVWHDLPKLHSIP
jgi:hypothetical protein